MQTSFRRARWAVPVAAALVLLGCPSEEPEIPPPTAEEVRSHFEYAGDLSVDLSGNVAHVRVGFDPEEYARGGDLWAKAFPYIFLLSPATREAFDTHPGLGGVRVISVHPTGDTIAQAMLPRGELNQITWPRAVNVAARARRDGTERPGTMQELVRWGEDHTEFEYNPDHIGQR